MKTIQGVGRRDRYGGLWLTVVPDDAKSCTDPRGTIIVAPRSGDIAHQNAYLEGYTARVKDEQRIREGRTYGVDATKGATP